MSPGCVGRGGGTSNTQPDAIRSMGDLARFPIPTPPPRPPPLGALALMQREWGIYGVSPPIGPSISIKLALMAQA